MNQQQVFSVVNVLLQLVFKIACVIKISKHIYNKININTYKPVN
jgi:hypothetical protein